MNHDRIGCCVPFCRRTRKNELGFSEWICGDHWREIPKPYRRTWGRLRRTLRRGYSPAEIPALEARRYRLWSRVKRAAIERAVGL
jgi:hypothetical protein